jgi:carbon storage regulator CsrA
MLVLSRRDSESVVVGDRTDPIESAVRITVIEIKKAMVRLGFGANAGIYINRWDVWHRIHNPVPSVLQ